MASTSHAGRKPEPPADDNGYFEALTKSVFDAGFSWKVVREKWTGFQKAFDSFDVDTVAAYDEPDVDRLLADEGIVRNRRKIRATIENARVMQELVAEHGSFESYLRTLDGSTWQQRERALTRAFKNLGPSGTYWFLWRVGEEVPPLEGRAN
jgi:DNA-3-methyladenine glycosylase I